MKTMQVKINEAELKLALADWLQKQIPELMKDGQAKFTLGEITTYPPAVNVTVEFVLPQAEAAKV